MNLIQLFFTYVLSDCLVMYLYYKVVHTEPISIITCYFPVDVTLFIFYE